MQLNNSGCDSEQAVVCLDYQNDWAIQKHNAPLDGLIGAECSAGRYFNLIYYYFVIFFCFFTYLIIYFNFI